MSAKELLDRFFERRRSVEKKFVAGVRNQAKPRIGHDGRPYPRGVQRYIRLCTFEDQSGHAEAGEHRAEIPLTHGGERSGLDNGTVPDCRRRNVATPGGM